ncbi:hypothetical protein QBC39DRAFT_347391 [Podospora conica]|nr:hypothetical protein QBC39DRAFT_347391 [Schizothecium conicum]
MAYNNDGARHEALTSLAFYGIAAIVINMVLGGAAISGAYVFNVADPAAVIIYCSLLQCSVYLMIGFIWMSLYTISGAVIGGLEEITKGQEEINKCQKNVKKSQEEAKRDQEKLEKSQEEAKRDQEKLKKSQEEVKKGQQAFQRDQEEIMMDLEEVKRAQLRRSSRSKRSS